MKIDPIKSQEIEDYLSGRLGNNEKRQFESELTESAVLAEEVQVQAIAQELINIEGRTELKTQLNTRFDNYSERQKMKITPRRLFWIAVAASVTVLLLVLGYNSLKSPKELPALFAENFELSILGQVRSGNADLTLQNSYSELSKAYAKNDWEMAKEIIFKRLEDSHSSVLQQGEWTLALGGVYMAEKKPLLAIEVLEKQAGNDYYTDQIQWYLGLAKLQTNDRAGAKMIFTQIAADSSHYKEITAKAIMEELK